MTWDVGLGWDENAAELFSHLLCKYRTVVGREGSGRLAAVVRLVRVPRHMS